MRMGKGTGIIAVVLAGGVALGGCGSKTSAPAGPATASYPPVSAADFADALAHALCDHEAACCEKLGPIFNASACSSAARANGMTRLPPFGQDQAFDPVAAGDCLGGLAARLDQCTIGANSELPEACARLIVGTQPLGGACNSDGDCAPIADAHVGCLSTAGALPACARLPEPVFSHGALGQACVGTCVGSGASAQCFYTLSGGATTGVACYASDGVVCGDASTCVPLPAAGEPCVDGECAAGATCAGQLCAPKLVDGAACSYGAQCESVGCDGGYKCGPRLAVDTNTCAGDPELP